MQRYKLPVLLLRRSNHVQVQKLKRFKSLRTFSSEFHEIEVEAIERPFELKHVLYPESNDATIKEINACSSLEELSKFLDKSALEIAKKEHICQLIVVLNEHVSELGLFLLDPVIARVEKLLPELTTDELTCCYIYLNKLGVNFRHPTMEKMTSEILRRINQIDKFDLQCLSRFTYVMNTEKDLYTSMLSVSTLPMIHKHLEECQNADDLHLVTVNLNNVSHVVSTSLLDIFKAKIEEFLDQELLNETTVKCILRIVNFLNYPHWSFRNTSLIRRLLLELECNIEMLDVKSVVTLHRAFQSQLESARLIPIIVNRAKQLIKDEPSVELLALAALNVTPDQRFKTAEMTRHFLSTYQIKSTDSGEVLQTLFKIVRLLKISDINLCDTYWTKALNEIYGTKLSSINYRLSRHIQKYMFFNNNLGGTYRHEEFEKSMTEMLLVELKSTLVPRDFAMFTSFIIAYGDGSGRQEIPQHIVDKVAEINDQFTIKDCLILSRGIQILKDLRVRRLMSPELEGQVEMLNHLLSRSAKRHMSSNNLHLTEMNSIIRAYINRKGEKILDIEDF